MSVQYKNASSDAVSFRGTQLCEAFPSMDVTSVVQAELASRDFTAERGEVVVISNGTVTAKDRERDQQERIDAEFRHQHRYPPKYVFHDAVSGSLFFAAPVQEQRSSMYIGCTTQSSTMMQLQP